MERKDILLIYPEYTYPRKNPPLGLAYLAAYLEQEGFQPLVLDFNVLPLTNQAFKAILHSRPWLLLGVSFMTSQFSEVLRMSGLIKEVLPQTLLVAGGPHPSSIPDRTLQEVPGLDVIVKGEGEITLTELARVVAADHPLDGVAGLYYRVDGTVVNTGERPLIEDINQMPFAAWKYIDVWKYKVFNSGAGSASGSDAPTFALLSSRGCPNPCTFCDSHTIFTRKFRARSAENIFAEVMVLHREYGMVEFDFVDDLITVNKSRVLAFCQLICETGIPFRWMANARVNTVDYEMLKAMKEAGCARVDFGVESGDPKVLKLMRKNITEQQIREAHSISKELGIATGSFTMVGNMGETKESIDMTVALLKDIGEDVMVSIACPYPGTELYRLAKEKGFINTEDWSQYVTSPVYSPGYRPLMRTEYRTEKEILESFYYLHSFFARRKFEQRYGRFFYLSPRFYKKWILEAQNLTSRFGMATSLVSARIKGLFK